MQLYFVRHGQSEANIARVFSNRGYQHPLTAQGRAQAHALAAHLQGQPITRIFTSPLQRAVETAQILSAALSAPVTQSDALREWDVGIYENTDDPRGWQLHTQVQEDWFIHGNLDARMPEGESFNDIKARFVPFVEQLLADDAGETVLLVAHGGLYHAMLPVVFGNVDHAFVAQHPFDNTAYALAEHRPHGLTCLVWCGVKFEE